MKGTDSKVLSKRLMDAYTDVSPKLRVLARRDFCHEFGVCDDTFRAKRSGQKGYVVTLDEVKWMENYKPVIVPA